MAVDLTIHGVDESQYDLAGSKFISFPPGATVGAIQQRNIEVIDMDWDTPGSSIKVDVQVTEEGADNGKKEKISFGVSPEAIWKGKDIYRAITGGEMPMVTGSDKKNHPKPDPGEVIGKKAVGVWKMTAGRKGGDPDADVVYYPKLDSIPPAGAKTENLGI